MRRELFVATLAVLLCASYAIMFGQDTPAAPAQSPPRAFHSRGFNRRAFDSCATTGGRVSGHGATAGNSAYHGHAGGERGDGCEAEIRG